MRIGITGGIGAGKSTIARILQAMNFPVYNSDERAKWLMNNHSELVQLITQEFGPESYLNQSLNRPVIAQQLFSNAEKQQWMREVVHPFVRNDFDAWCLQQQSTIVFQESALIFESGIQKRLNKVVVVMAPEEVRIQRTIQRDNTNREEVKRRMAAQVSDENRMTLGNYFIYNDDEQLVIPQVVSVLEAIKSNK